MNFPAEECGGVPRLLGAKLRTICAIAIAGGDDSDAQHAGRGLCERKTAPSQRDERRALKEVTPR